VDSKFNSSTFSGQPSKFHRAALYYARRGWPVLPLKPGEKVPLTEHGYKDATTDEPTIRTWWTRHPNANVGIVTGSASGLAVLDVDPRNGGNESLQALISQHGPLPVTPTVQTGGGFHYYFAIPQGVSIRTRKIAPGVELKANGGYVVAPPSLHPSGTPYRWLPAHSPKDLQIAPIPDWLLEIPQEPPPEAEDDQVVPEGRRHDFLVRLAGKLRAAGFGVEAIEAALIAENARRCRPPLPEREVRAIAKSMDNYPPRPNRPADGGQASEAVTSDLDNAFTDWNLAKLFAQLAKDRVLYVPQWGWLVWDGRRWAVDPGGCQVMAWAADVLPRHFALKAAEAKDTETRREYLHQALKAMGRQRLTAALDLAKGLFLADPGDFDRDPFAFNVLNGTLDLRTGQLRPHNPADRITKLAPVTYDPAARAPTWDRFIQDIFLGDTDLMDYVRRALGYSITGDTREDAVFICYGTGRNGKSVLLETIAAVAGDYARSVPQDLILARGEKDDTHPAVLAELVGVRLALIVEAEEDRRLNATRLKALSGQDTLTARHLYRSYFNFRPQAKLWMRTNYKPRVSDHSPAMWERLRLIPFRAYFPPERRDKDLRTKLLAEASGILNWLVAGVQDWLRAGLQEPPAVREATETYRQEQDVIGQWISERCVVDPQAVTPFKELFDDYQAWCEETGDPPVSARRFATSLEDRGFPKVVLPGGRGKARQGIRLKKPNDPPASHPPEPNNPDADTDVTDVTDPIAKSPLDPDAVEKSPRKSVRSVTSVTPPPKARPPGSIRWAKN
jgi:putative DNA primase/helicase